jgi:ribosomal protein L37E
MTGSTQPSITCPACGMTSYNPNDIREGYCGNCHDWTTPTPQ